MTWRWMAAVGLGMWLVCGCAPTQPVAPAGASGTWQQLTSEHFVVGTNLPTALAEKELRKLERAYWVLDRAAFHFNRRELPGPVRVVIVADIDDLAPLGYRGFAGVFRPSSDTLLLPGAALDEPLTQETFLHELSHRFIHDRLGEVPLWLDEGLADYYCTTEVGSDVVRFGKHVIGKTFGDDWSAVQGEQGWRGIVPRGAVLSIGQLRELGSEKFYGEYDEQPTREQARHRVLSYASAWANVAALHMVPDGDNRFFRYLAGMSDGISEPQAFAAAYGDLPSSALSAALAEVVNRHLTDVVSRTISIEDSASPIHARPISAADAQLVLAQLRAPDPAHPDAFMRNVERALAMDPHNPEAFFVRASAHWGRKQDDAALADLETARKLAPSSTRYLRALALALLRMRSRGPLSPERQAELDDVAEQLRAHAQSAVDFDALAQILLEVHHNTAAGRQFAERALRIDRGCYDCFQTLAAAGAGRGDYKAAVAAQRKALQLMPESLRRKEALALLEEYRRKLAEAAPPSAGAGASSAPAAPATAP